MKKEVVKSLILILSFVVIFSSMVSAVPSGTCDIVPRILCVEAPPEIQGDHVIMGISMEISSETNAHGELITENNYDYVLCCNMGNGDTTCSETNKIIGLSSTTNAHAEVSEGITYSNDVCYEDFICESRDNTCLEDQIEILSLSADTNAHIGKFDNYDTKICCGEGSVLGLTCTLISAKWNKEEIVERIGAYLEVTGSGPECNGMAVSFEVTEGGIIPQKGYAKIQPDNVSFNEESGQYIARGLWYAEWVDDFGNPEYYFTVSLVNSPSTNIKSSDPELKVSKLPDNFCSSIVTCDDYESEGECESDESLCDVAKDVNLPDVDCDDENTICGCAWDDETSTCGFDYIELEEDECGNVITGCNYGCTLCESATTGYYCNLGASCPYGEIPGDDDDNCEFGIDGCLSNDCGDGERDTCASPFYCNSGKCFSVEGPPASAGTCEVTQITESECDQDPVGYKTLRLTGTWTGEGECGTKCQECESMSEDPLTVPCPAQIQLPFFGNYSITIIIAVVVLIYVLIALKERKNKKKISKKKK